MTEETFDSPGVRVPPPLVFAGAFLLGMAMERLLPLRRRESRAAGTGLIVGGLALAAWSRVIFLRRGTSVLPFRAASALVAEGPFQISRNPIYVGFTAMYLGGSLLRRSAWPLLLLPCVVFAIQRAVVDREEAYLERRFGEEYLSYKSRVRRWL